MLPGSIRENSPSRIDEGVCRLARLVIIVLRFILIFALIYYFIKLLGRWLSSGTRSESVRGGKGSAQAGSDYNELTDQAIEDANFEDISEEDKS